MCPLYAIQKHNVNIINFKDEIDDLKHDLEYRENELEDAEAKISELESEIRTLEAKQNELLDLLQKAEHELDRRNNR